MSELYKDKESIFEYFSIQCEELFKEKDKQTKPKETGSKKKEIEGIKAQNLKWVADFLTEVLLTIRGGNDSDEERSYSPNYEIIPDLFHKFITFYFENKIKFDKIYPTMNFDWSYDKFKTINENSSHFKIPKETMNLLIRELNRSNCKHEWLESNLLKQNYQQFSMEDPDYFSTLKTLILLVLRSKKRQIKDIKFSSLK